MVDMVLNTAQIVYAGMFLVSRSKLKVASLLKCLANFLVSYYKHFSNVKMIV